MYFFFRVVEKLLILYFSAYFLADLLLFIHSVFIFIRSRTKHVHPEPDYRGHAISIIIPAYNEEVSIVNCIKMLQGLDYEEYEIIVVNDGSTDQTMDTILKAFDLIETHPEPYRDIQTQPVRHYYRAAQQDLLVIDKQNGGKADSINAGIDHARNKYVCTIDADSILDPQALKEVVKPMIHDPRNFVSGGQLAASNDVVLKGNKVEASRMPSNIWVLWQILEYIKSFMISRLGLSRINSLLIMSGAFSLYKREDLKAVGGFLTPWNDHPYLEKIFKNRKNRQTVCEDMEIVVRLWRYYKEKNLKGKASFLPKPVCWTEMPANGKDLYKQRVRWHLGLAQSISLHRSLIFEPRYGSIGLIAMPYYFFFELLSPIVKAFTLIFLIIVSATGLINTAWVLLLLLSIVLVTAIIMSSITVVVEWWSQSQGNANRDALRYKNFGDWIKLLSASIVSDLTYALFRTYAQMVGIVMFLRQKSEWNKFERKGVKTSYEVDDKK